MQAAASVRCQEVSAIDTLIFYIFPLDGRTYIAVLQVTEY